MARPSLSQQTIALIILVLIPILAALMTRLFGQGQPDATGNSFLPAMFWVIVTIAVLSVLTWIWRKHRGEHDTLPPKRGSR